MKLRLIEKYFMGIVTPEEKEEVLEFFREQQLNPKNEEMLRKWWEQYSSDWEQDETSERILNNIHKELNIKKASNNQFYVKLVGIAATVLLVGALFFTLYSSRLETSQDRNSVVETIIKQAPLGVKLQFQLSDGTVIYLNSNSKLSFPEHFDESYRKVTLEGEGFFDVAKSPDRPFVVECNGSLITVLGTSFNISSYNKETVVVSVTSGKVKIDFKEDKAQTIFLSPGEQATLNTDHLSMHVQHFNLYKTIAWKEGVIIFDESGLHEIIETLSRWYGVEIEISGEVDRDQVNWKYTGEFKNEPLENVLNGIAFVKGFKYTIEGKKVQLVL